MKMKWGWHSIGGGIYMNKYGICDFLWLHFDGFAIIFSSSPQFLLYHMYFVALQLNSVAMYYTISSVSTLTFAVQDLLTMEMESVLVSNIFFHCVWSTYCIVWLKIFLLIYCPSQVIYYTSKIPSISYITAFYQEWLPTDSVFLKKKNPECWKTIETYQLWVLIWFSGSIIHIFIFRASDRNNLF